jgi:hypothetical protein
MNANVADFFDEEDNDQDINSYNKYINETIIRQNIQNYVNYENIYKVFLYIFLYTYIYIYIYIYIHIIHIYIFIYIHIYTYIYILIHVYLYICVYIYIYYFFCQNLIILVF